MEKKTILLIEDNRQQSELISRFLRKNDYNVIHAYDGRTGISMAKEHIPDCIILDYKLPEINGLDVLKIMKSHTPTINIPIIMVSANNISPVKCSFLRKPFEFDKLKNIIDSIPTFM